MSAKEQRISTGYTPRKLQADLHVKIKRFNVLVAHRRFGKTIFVINEMLHQALMCEKKNPQYAYIAPFYGQAKRIAWDYIKEYTKNLPGVSYNEHELRVDIPRDDRGDRVRFILLGGENPGAIRGIYLDGVIMDEFAEMDPTVWTQVVRPALSDRMGWAIFIGTPKGQNHFYDLYLKARNDDEWLTQVFRASETGVIPHKELDALKRSMDPEEYEQELECSFTASNVGAYYGNYIATAEKESRITNVPYDSALLVDTYWDLGIDDTTAIWFVQQSGHQVRIIDYTEESGKGIDFYVKEINNRNYVYNEHNLPHDAAARELGTGKTREETLRTLGLKRTYVHKRQSVEDGIHAVRMLLSRCWFDAKKCERGIIALKNYQRQYDQKEKIFKNKPKHDWSSHASDAFRLLALAIKETRINSELPRFSVNDYNPLGGIQDVRRSKISW